MKNVKRNVIILICINIILGYLIFNSINSEIEFQKIAKERISENIQKLKDLRQVQVKYKQTKGVFADNFESLIDFLENDSISIIKATGETPDSIINGQQMSDELALELGLTKGTVSRALNGYEDISTKTRQRVTEVARIRGYVPTTQARRLAMGLTETIGLVLPPMPSQPVNTFVSLLLVPLSRLNAKVSYFISTYL